MKPAETVAQNVRTVAVRAATDGLKMASQNENSKSEPRKDTDK